MLSIPTSFLPFIREICGEETRGVGERGGGRGSIGGRVERKERVRRGKDTHRERGRKEGS